MNQTDRTCDKDGCQKLVRARGMCSMHYERWARRNKPRIYNTFDYDAYWQFVKQELKL